MEAAPSDKGRGPGERGGGLEVEEREVNEDDDERGEGTRDSIVVYARLF